MIIQLSDFSFHVKSHGGKGNFLRFTLSFYMPFETGEVGEYSTEGCMCYWKYNNKLVWSPPLNYRGNRAQQFHWCNKVIYNKVLDALKDAKEGRLIKPLDKPGVLEKIMAKDIDLDVLVNIK